MGRIIMLTTRKIIALITHSFIFLLLTVILLTGCATIDTVFQKSGSTAESDCTVTEPAWVKPPEDSAVSGSPEPGYYFVNEDRSIWASAWWTEAEDYVLRVSEEGLKVGWFRPEGADIEITGQRLDAQAAPLLTHVPCCYPTRFQATGLYFPTQGCWEVTAQAADSVLTFTVWVEPE